MKKNKRNGFTLFELLVSISIIGILTALASVAYSGAQKKARDARRVEDMKLIQTAAEQFYSQMRYVYPTSTSPSAWIPTGGQSVLTAFPIDPKNDSTYQYTYNIGNTYCACAQVENTNNANSTNRNCNFGIGTSGLYFCVKSQQ